MTSPHDPNETEEVLTTPATPGAAALPTDADEDEESSSQ